MFYVAFKNQVRMTSTVHARSIKKIQTNDNSKMKGFIPVEKVHTFHGESVDTALLVLLYLCLKVFHIYL